MESAISAVGLSRRFGAKTAVDAIDLEIPAGRIYGFLGPNGSGKSTTIRLLCGLLEPSAGAVTVLGHEIPREAEALRNHIGYMTQKFSLFEDLSVQENLRFMAQIYGLARRKARARIAENVANYQLGELLRQRAGTMSGGQKQRLALACVTLHEPRLLLLDEPTSAVDPQSRRDFWDSIFALAENGATVLVSTHFMDEAERCHRLAILDSGRVVAEGEPQELAASVDAVVLEVRTDNPLRSRSVLADQENVLSVTQLGSRLRVTVPSVLDDGSVWLRDKLAAQSIEAEVEITSANLEDVFVAAIATRRAQFAETA